jgi:hypothetical protein
VLLLAASPSISPSPSSKLIFLRVLMSVYHRCYRNPGVWFICFVDVGSDGKKARSVPSATSQKKTDRGLVCAFDVHQVSHRQRIPSDRVDPRRKRQQKICSRLPTMLINDDALVARQIPRGPLYTLARRSSDAVSIYEAPLVTTGKTSRITPQHDPILILMLDKTRKSSADVLVRRISCPSLTSLIYIIWFAGPR